MSQNTKTFKKNLELLNENNLTSVEKISLEWVKDIEEANQNGEDLEYIWDRALDIEKDTGGKPTKIIFTVGGPYVYLDLFCEPGYIKVFSHEFQAKAKLSTTTLENILDNLEELGYAN